MWFACVFAQLCSHNLSSFSLSQLHVSSPPRLILNFTSFISEALVLFRTNYFQFHLSLNSQSTSHQSISQEAHTQGKGTGQKNPTCTPLHPHITTQKVPLLAVCGYREVPPNTSWIRGLLEDNFFFKHLLVFLTFCPLSDLLFFQCTHTIQLYTPPFN